MYYKNSRLTTDENSLLHSATAKRKSTLQLNSFNANNSTSVEPISKTGAKTIITLIYAIRSKGTSPMLCAQTNAQPDYATLSRRSRLRLYLCLSPTSFFRLHLFRRL